MKNIPRTFKSYEADAYIITSCTGRELFRSIFNRLLWRIYDDLSNLEHELNMSKDYLSTISMLDPKTVNKQRKALFDQGLISYSYGKVKVNIKYYLSLVFLFSQIKDDAKKRSIFMEAARNNDIEQLSAIGFRFISPEEMREMLAILLYSGNKSQEKSINGTIDPKVPQSTQERYDCGKNTSIDPIIPQSTQKRYDLGKNGSIDPRTVQLAQKWYDCSKSGSIDPYLGQSIPEWGDFFSDFLGQIGELTQKWTFDKLLNEVFNGQSNYDCTEIGSIEDEGKKKIAFGAVGLQIMLISYLRNDPTLGQLGLLNCTTFTPHNKKEKKEKEKTVRGERSETRYIKAGKEIKDDEEKIEETSDENSQAEKRHKACKSFFENLGKVEIKLGDNEDNPSDNFPEDLKFEDDEEEEEGLGLFGRPKKEDPFMFFHPQDLVLLKNPYKAKPYYSDEEKFGLVDPEEAVKSPVRLFLYNFLYRIFDWYEDFEHTRREYLDNEYKELKISTGPTSFSDEELDIVRMLRNVPLVPALEIDKAFDYAINDTCDDIEQGYTSLKGVDYKLEFDGIPSEVNLDFISDWEVFRNLDVKLDISKFRNIEAPDIPQLKAPRTKEEIKNERRRSRVMVMDIMASSEETLTPVELAIRKFFKEYGNFDEDNHLNGFISSKPFYIPGDDKTGEKGETIINTVQLRVLGRHLFLQPVLQFCQEAGIKPDLFFQSLEKPGKMSDVEIIESRGTVFSYTNVANINLANGWKSQITSE